MNSDRAFLLLTSNYLSFPPPPPRYPVPVAYAAGASNGMAVQIVETNNVVRHPEEGCSLQVGEGMYLITQKCDNYAIIPTVCSLHFCARNLRT